MLTVFLLLDLLRMASNKNFVLRSNEVLPCYLSILIGKAYAKYFNNLAFTTAAGSSNIGSDTVLIDATLSLDITSCDDT